MAVLFFLLSDCQTSTDALAQNCPLPPPLLIATPPCRWHEYSGSDSPGGQWSVSSRCRCFRGLLVHPPPRDTAA